jgi:hypothetical protein
VKVEISEPAALDIQRVDNWWRGNRDRKDLFREELFEALAHIGETPELATLPRERQQKRNSAAQRRTSCLPSSDPRRRGARCGPRSDPEIIRERVAARCRPCLRLALFGWRGWRSALWLGVGEAGDGDVARGR